MAPTRGASKQAGSSSKSSAKRSTSHSANGPAGPAKKKKFQPKTHSTIGVAVGKSALKKTKDPKKKEATLIAKAEKELPKLNMITPAGVVKPKGKKKGKMFVEDKDKMMSILSRVNDSKEGQIQSKLERGRRLEAIREARRKEDEARMGQRKSKMEDAKDAVRKKRKRKSLDNIEETPETTSNHKSKKRVAFA
ncbi:60S ribosomal subunit assembly/export protein [Rhizina undulata]